MFISYFLIFASRVLDVTLMTIRTIMVVQGRKVHSAVIGFFEVAIYVVVLSSVVSNLNDPFKLLAYCLGYATGNYVGITIESKIALGNLSAQIILKTTENCELVNKLRENGFGVTVIQGEGINGHKDVLLVAFHRKDLTTLKKKVYEYDGTAFITVNNVNPISGGYFRAIKK